MFKHKKQLFHPVGVERPNPQYATLLQEQLGLNIITKVNGVTTKITQLNLRKFVREQHLEDMCSDAYLGRLGRYLLYGSVNTISTRTRKDKVIPTGMAFFFFLGF